MSINGFVPAANAGVVDVGSKVPGTGIGIFEETVVNGKAYSTVLRFKSMPVTLAKGTNAGFVGIEMYDFGNALMLLKGVNVAIAVTENDTNVTGNLQVLVGTVTGTDLVTPGANEKSIIPVTASAGGTYGTKNKVIALNARFTNTINATGGPQILDGTSSASKFFLNLNATLANVVASASFTLNGTVELHYEDLGGDLAVGV